MELGLKTPEGWGVRVYVYVHTCAWKGFGTFFSFLRQGLLQSTLMENSKHSQG